MHKKRRGEEQEGANGGRGGQRQEGEEEVKEAGPFSVNPSVTERLSPLFLLFFSSCSSSLLSGTFLSSSSPGPLKVSSAVFLRRSSCRNVAALPAVICVFY